MEMFDIVSEQSTARPGCVIKLGVIDDTVHHSHTTQLLHVFQESLVIGTEAKAQYQPDVKTSEFLLRFNVKSHYQRDVNAETSKYY